MPYRKTTYLIKPEFDGRENEGLEIDRPKEENSPDICCIKVDLRHIFDIV